MCSSTTALQPCTHQRKRRREEASVSWLSRHANRHGSGRRGAVTELAVDVGSPAIRDTVRGDAAAVTAARAHGCERESARDEHRGGAVCGRAVAELAVEAAPPAVGNAVGRKGAGVTVPGAETLEGQAARNRHWRAVVAQAAAELAVEVASPAVGRTTG